VTLETLVVEMCLREFMESVDYDLHKAIERPEDGGPDDYPMHAERFIETYERLSWKG